VAYCFKRIGLEAALEALREARRSRTVSPEELWRYARVNRVANVIRPYLEAVGRVSAGAAASIQARLLALAKARGEDRSGPTCSDSSGPFMNRARSISRCRADQQQIR
jgi:hypothetical protein